MRILFRLLIVPIPGPGAGRVIRATILEAQPKAEAEALSATHMLLLEACQDQGYQPIAQTESQ